MVANADSGASSTRATLGTWLRSNPLTRISDSSPRSSATGMAKVRANGARASHPAPRAVRRLLSQPLPYAARPLPLRDPTPDPGLFGPDSVTWVVMREPRLLLAAGRALLLQAANPLVAQGAIEHSTYKTDPYGRLERTVRWVTVVCFGTAKEAERISGRVNGLHRRVAGSLPAANATSRVAGGTRYSASDPGLLRWVHASFVDTMLVAHDALIGGSQRQERDAFVREWDAVGAAHGALPEPVLAERGGATQVRRTRGTARAGTSRSGFARGGGDRPAPARRLADAPSGHGHAGVHRDRAPARPSCDAATGSLWTPAHAAAFAALTRSLRLATPGLPRRLRISPVYDLALARARRAAGPMRGPPDRTVGSHSAG